MAETPDPTLPWLVAVWPGMGSVAMGAGKLLLEQLDAKPLHQLPASRWFDIRHVEVTRGLARPGRRPRCLFFEYKHPNDGRDLILFVGEAQPQEGGYALCEALLDYAMQRGVSRVITFAAMATQLHPADDPRVFGVSTDDQLLSELREQNAEILREGQIGGLNGVLLAAAMNRNIPGMCLMGELPFFAAGTANPKASMAVLRVFADMADLHLDFSPLEAQSEQVDEALMDLLRQLRENAQEEPTPEGMMLPEEHPAELGEASVSEPSGPDQETHARIESLFDAAIRDRAKAFQLKEELDRLGLFKHYEDRFLDLFRRAE